VRPQVGGWGLGREAGLYAQTFSLHLRLPIMHGIRIGIQLVQAEVDLSFQELSTQLGFQVALRPCTNNLQHVWPSLPAGREEDTSGGNRGWQGAPATSPPRPVITCLLFLHPSIPSSTARCPAQEHPFCSCTQAATTQALGASHLPITRAHPFTSAPPTTCGDSQRRASWGRGVLEAGRGQSRGSGREGADRAQPCSPCTGRAPRVSRSPAGAGALHPSSGAAQARWVRHV
jgi:hypothetical protein